MLNEFFRLSKLHKENACLLCILMFTDAHANIKEMLKNQSYVDALDEISSDEIVVFWAALNKARVKIPDISSSSFSYVVPMEEEPKDNREIFHLFSIKDSYELPLLVTFAFDGNDDIIFRKHSISDQTIENSFLSLKNILTEKAKLLSDFDDSLVNDKQKMFKELELFDCTNKGVNIFSRLINIAATFRSSTSI